VNVGFDCKVFSCVRPGGKFLIRSRGMWCRENGSSISEGPRNGPCSPAFGNIVGRFKRRPGLKLLGNRADLMAITAARERHGVGLWALTDPAIDSYKGEVSGIKNTPKSKLAPLRNGPEG
jgi:hypothetical protein